MKLRCVLDDSLPSQSPIDGEELDLSEIQDLVLSMEYDVAPGGHRAKER